MATKSNSLSPSVSTSPFTTNQLIDVLNLLKRCGFPQARWHELGLTLGLHKNTLDIIKRDSVTTYECLTECLSKWLSRADNVDSKGGATFDSLSDALKSMNENAAADNLDQERPTPPTSTSKPLIGGPPLSPTALIDILDDKPTVPELIEFHELLIKGQLEESLFDADTIRKIRNAASADEGMLLLSKVFEERPTLLHKMREATEKIKGSSQKSEMTLKTSPPPVPKPRKKSLSTPLALPPSPRRHKKLSTETPPIPKPRSKTAPSLQTHQVLGNKEGSILSTEAVHGSPGQVQPLRQLHVEPHSKPTVIQLSSKEEVALSIESLHHQFIGLVTKVRKHFIEIVSNEKLQADDIIYHAEEYLGQGLKLSEINMHTIFDAIRPHYNFFNFGLLKSLAHHFISSSDDIHAKLTEYIESVDKFSESSQLKHIRSAIKDKLLPLPAATSPTTSDQTKPVVIKLNDKWEEMTLKNFERVLQYYFGHLVEDIFTIVEIDRGSIIITLIIPTSLSQPLIDTINNKRDSMSRLGILEIAVDNNAIPIRREYNNNFDVSLHESVKAGDSFEVSMLLQLGADPISKDEKRKSAVEIANEGGHRGTQIKEILLTSGEKDQCTQSPTAESIYTVCHDYHKLCVDDLLVSEGEQVEIYEKESSFKWKGRSLVSGKKSLIPSSCVYSSIYSKLESLQLLEFILSVKEVFLPILQKIRNNLSINNEKASLFLEAINDDPIMISALRQDKEQHDKRVTSSVKWNGDSVFLTYPSPVQCNEVIISNINEVIHLSHSSTNSTVSLLSSTKLHTLSLRRLEIWYTPLANDCIQYLCILLTNNKTMQELNISLHSVSDRGVTNICQALEHNSTLTSLVLYANPLITSTSGQALSHLLLNNSSLVELDLRCTLLSIESILIILNSLMDNNNIRKLWLDERHKVTCVNTYLNYHLIQDRVAWCISDNSDFM
ncbi:PREDICTED: uncharacterized protein LOC109582345 [Amphimedon queenslandica]|uniref:Death domain-containing protein n=1 Tax=Amphimedon queenslandica TaxID=400682 RepID=A0A1X7URW4_AMPQE|nr:PREDICTED: uncharacterized protein LOC109582345 [Amphimedon queenslandica]|eukprot:XP_019852568.1 PREDICTED: uncharacterized protein LOC109582345 [Amphimedon queenslandica]